MLLWVEFRRRSDPRYERRGSLSRSCAEPLLSRFLQFKQIDEGEDCCLHVGAEPFRSPDKAKLPTLGLLDQVRYRLELYDAKSATK